MISATKMCKCGSTVAGVHNLAALRETLLAIRPKAVAKHCCYCLQQMHSVKAGRDKELAVRPRS
eukprot:3026208-Amphidinium_carterae.1